MEQNKIHKDSIRLSDGTELDSFVVRLLGNRGILGQENISKFLEPKLNDLPNPFLMNGMDKAVLIIEQAINEKQPILIWGDYDVDGTTATSLLLKFFATLGCEAEFYIPNRLSEGYGLKENGLRGITNSNHQNNKVLITVDNGISAHNAVKLASELGYKTIITDHHTPPPIAVAADAILNPGQNTCSFPAKNLAGVGVAFYLAMGIRSHLLKNNFFVESKKIPNLKELLDLVTVGTIADMVPLHGINRILVRAGMETMSRQENKGLTALCRACNLDPGFIRSEDISFQIAPKINAAGRLGDANKAVNLFLAKTKKEGREIAKDLVNKNESRKNINISDFDKAIHDIESSIPSSDYSVIVNGKYHIGVAGIVASNLVEKYKKPSFVLCKDSNGGYRGSGRSIPGIDLYLALESCSKVLLNFGGHKMAGGLSIQAKNIHIFKELFDLSICNQSGGKFIDSTDTVDAEIEIIKLFKKSILRQLYLFEPFGQGNPQLIFRDTKPRFLEITPIGKDKNHLRIRFSGKDNSKNHTVKGIAFGFGAFADKCLTANDTEVLYSPSINFFRGKRSWQARVTSIVFPNT